MRYVVPVDKYIQNVPEAFRDVPDPNRDDRDFEPERAPVADEYSAGRGYTCTHCNTAFKSIRREPKCPFCHKRPT